MPHFISSLVPLFFFSFLLFLLLLLLLPLLLQCFLPLLQQWYFLIISFVLLVSAVSCSPWETTALKASTILWNSVLSSPNQPVALDSQSVVSEQQAATLQGWVLTVTVFIWVTCHFYHFLVFALNNLINFNCKRQLKSWKSFYTVLFKSSVSSRPMADPTGWSPCCESLITLPATSTKEETR